MHQCKARRINRRIHKHTYHHLLIKVTTHERSRCILTNLVFSVPQHKNTTNAHCLICSILTLILLHFTLSMSLTTLFQPPRQGVRWVLGFGDTTGGLFHPHSLSIITTVVVFLPLPRIFSSAPFYATLSHHSFEQDKTKKLAFLLSNRFYSPPRTQNVNTTLNQKKYFLFFFLPHALGFCVSLLGGG